MLLWPNTIALAKFTNAKVDVFVNGQLVSGHKLISIFNRKVWHATFSWHKEPRGVDKPCHFLHTGVPAMFTTLGAVSLIIVFTSRVCSASANLNKRLVLATVYRPITFMLMIQVTIQNARRWQRSNAAGHTTRSH